MKTIQVPYKSGWYTVILPTLITVGVWGGLFVLILALLGWNAPNWLGILLCFGGVIPGLAVAYVTYPFLMRLAERERGVLTLEGDRLRWRTGHRWREIDLSRAHSAKIAAGTSGLGEANASIGFLPGGEMLHLRGARREEVLRRFPAPYFVETLAILPKEGLWGFEFSAEDPAAAAFFAEVLERLWHNRQQNERFRLYQKFPWERRPRPAFKHIRMIELQTCPPEDQAFLETLKAQVVSSLAEVQVTPDYLIGWLSRSLRSKVNAQADVCCVMPLGYITVEVSFPRPNWKPFVIGQALRQAVAASGAAAGPSLENRRYLYVRGKGESGTPLELAFDWYEPKDKGYEEAEFLVRFIQTMAQGRDQAD